MDTIPIQPTPAEFDAFTRLDLPTFIERVFVELNPTTPYLDNFHIHVIAAELEAMRWGNVLRLIVNLPPRNLKSIIVSVAFVAWLLGHDPTSKIICVSYGQDLADNLARMCRQVMQSDWYKRLFRKTRLAPDRLAANAFETTEGGYRIATSVGGVITGLGADYILIDDPMKPQEAFSDAERNAANLWYRHTLISRLNDKKTGRIAIVMQRLHEDDMVGHVLQLEDWKLIALSAIAQAPETHVVRTPFGVRTYRRGEGEALHPEREPLSVLEDYRRTLGPEYFAAQFLQSPVPPGGNVIKIDGLRRFDSNAPPVFEQYVQSWDTASKATELSGYSVCTIWGVLNRCMYLIDLVRARFEYPDLRDTALALARGQYHGCLRPDLILIEDKASGQSLIQDLKREGIYRIEAVKPTTDKVTRMHAQTAVIANGRVYIPYDAPWLPDFLHELIAFPKGRYCDQVDSLSQALKWFNYTSDEPNFFPFMRENLERWRAAGADNKDRIVALRCEYPPSCIHTITGQLIYPDAHMHFHMRGQDAEAQLKVPGWSLVDAPH